MLSQSNFSFHFCEPYWIRYLKFLNVGLGFVISDPENRQARIFKVIEPEEKCMLLSAMTVKK